jgi:hypothetical protein
MRAPSYGCTMTERANVSIQLFYHSFDQRRSWKVPPIDLHISTFGQNALNQLRIENLSEVLTDESELLLGVHARAFESRRNSPRPVLLTIALHFYA